LFIVRHAEYEQFSISSEIIIEDSLMKRSNFHMTSVAGVGRFTWHEGRERIHWNEGRARKSRLCR
jgi:hypothetical protein